MLATILAESLGTFVFVAVILAASGDIAPFIIGLGLTIAIYFTSKASDAFLNPAVAFAALLKGSIDMPTASMYIVAELIGAVLAVMWWKMTLGASKK